MATITVRVTDEEKNFFDNMAKFEGISLSELLKKRTLESLEDMYDAKVADAAYEEYLENPKTKSIKEVAKEYGLL